jgi:hypothetical protein
MREMDAHYICRLGEEVRGPYAAEQLAIMWGNGALTADTQIFADN